MSKHSKLEQMLDRAAVRPEFRPGVLAKMERGEPLSATDFGAVPVRREPPAAP